MEKGSRFSRLGEIISFRERRGTEYRDTPRMYEPERNEDRYLEEVSLGNVHKVSSSCTNQLYTRI